MTASSSASWSRFSPPSNFVSGHVLTMWFMVCRWPQSQEGDWVRPHLCKLARHGPWPVRKRFIRDHVWQGSSTFLCWRPISTWVLLCLTVDGRIADIAAKDGITEPRDRRRPFCVVHFHTHHFRHVVTLRLRGTQFHQLQRPAGQEPVHCQQGQHVYYILCT